MNVSRMIDAESGLVTFTVTGKVTRTGIIEELGRMLGDPDFRKGASNLWDFRSADGSGVTSADIQQLAIFIEKNRDRRGDGYKVAFVVAREADFGMARVYEGYAASLPFDIRVFRRMEEALAWIRT